MGWAGWPVFHPYSFLPNPYSEIRVRYGFRSTGRFILPGLIHPPLGIDRRHEAHLKPIYQIIHFMLNFENPLFPMVLRPCRRSTKSRTYFVCIDFIFSFIACFHSFALVLKKAFPKICTLHNVLVGMPIYSFTTSQNRRRITNGGFFEAFKIHASMALHCLMNHHSHSHYLQICSCICVC